MERFFTRFGNGFVATTSKEIKESLIGTDMKTLEKYQKQNQMAMAMRPMEIDLQKWLAIDWSYASFAKARCMLLNTRPEEVIAYRQCDSRDKEVEQACREVLDMIVEHLTTTYPEYFQLTGSSIHNAITGETFNLKNPLFTPLEIAARLAVEDFNVLLPTKVKTGKDTCVQYQLAATATLFPAAWIIKNRVGSLVRDLHKPVPKWEEKLAVGVEARLRKVGFGLDGRCQPSDKAQTERLAVFPQIDQPRLDLGDLLFVQHGDKFYPPGIDPSPSTMIFRRERQTFRRITSVNGVLFTVHTSLQFLDEIEKEELAALIEHVKKLGEEHAAYKERNRWLPCLEKYAQEKFGLKV
jgi:hypothetical protein